MKRKTQFLYFPSNGSCWTASNSNVRSHFICDRLFDEMKVSQRVVVQEIRWLETRVDERKSWSLCSGHSNNFYRTSPTLFIAMASDYFRWPRNWWSRFVCSVTQPTIAVFLNQGSIFRHSLSCQIILAHWLEIYYARDNILHRCCSWVLTPSSAIQGQIKGGVGGGRGKTFWARELNGVTVWLLLSCFTVCCGQRTPHHTSHNCCNNKTSELEKRNTLIRCQPARANTNRKGFPYHVLSRLEKVIGGKINRKKWNAIW